MSADRQQAPWLPPRRFIRGFWFAHRALFRVTGGRVGLWGPKGNRYGTMRLTTVGRRSGQDRSVIVGYFEDGANLVTTAMNGWADEDPAWWLNLQSHPDARVDLAHGSRAVRARAADPQERSRLWAVWCQADKNWDAHSQRRSGETAVVILEPRAGS
jgi:deazaflavin-dependent oxidoreductase (nitroreductase family)